MDNIDHQLDHLQRMHQNRIKELVLPSFSIRQTSKVRHVRRPWIRLGFLILPFVFLTCFVIFMLPSVFLIQEYEYPPS